MELGGELVAAVDSGRDDDVGSKFISVVDDEDDEDEEGITRPGGVPANITNPA